MVGERVTFVYMGCMCMDGVEGIVVALVIRDGGMSVPAACDWTVRGRRCRNV